MLRVFLLLVGCVMASVGGYRLYGGATNAWPVAVWGVVVVLAVLFERWRYRHEDMASTNGWEKTEECFVDPESGKLMQVLYRADTGERRYVTVKDDITP